MLEFTGILNGQMVEEKTVSIAQICKHFKIEVPVNLVIERIVQKRDRFGQRKESNQAMFTPYFSAVFAGEQFTLRWYQNKAKRSDRATRYLPNRIRFAGTRVFNANEQELALFLMMHPENASSPFAGKKVVVRTSDKQAEAHARIDREKFEGAIRAMVLTDPDDNKIQRIARGFKYKGVSISTVHTANPASARIALLDMAKLHPEAVQEALSDDTTLIRGIVGIAEDAGRLSLRGNTWIVGSEVILDVSKAEDPQARMYEYLSEGGNLTKFLAKVYPQAEVEQIDVVGTAIDRGLIVIEDGKAYILDAGGAMSGASIGRFESLDEIRAADLPKPILVRIKKAL